MVFEIYISQIHNFGSVKYYGAFKPRASGSIYKQNY